MPKNTNHLKKGEVLTPGECLKAGKNNCFELRLQLDGNVVLYFLYPDTAAGAGKGNKKKGKTAQVVRWASNTEGSDIKELKMQTDGNLVLYSQAGKVKWASDTDGNHGAELELEDDGDLIIKVDPRGTIWQRPRP